MGLLGRNGAAGFSGRPALTLAVWLAFFTAAALLPAPVRAEIAEKECPPQEPMGILNLTAEEAGEFALVAVFILGGAVLLCLVLCATCFGYRAQVGVLQRRIRSLEAALVKYNEKPPVSPPSTVVYAEPAGDLPPPPPEDDPEEADEVPEDVKQPLPQTEVDVEVEPEPEGGEINHTYDDGDVEAALTDIEAAAADEA